MKTFSNSVRVQSYFSISHLPLLDALSIQEVNPIALEVGSPCPKMDVEGSCPYSTTDSCEFWQCLERRPCLTLDLCHQDNPFHFFSEVRCKRQSIASDTVIVSCASYCSSILAFTLRVQHQRTSSRESQHKDVRIMIHVSQDNRRIHTEFSETMLLCNIIKVAR